MIFSFIRLENQKLPIVKITQRYENKSLCGQLAEKNLEILRDNNSRIDIGSKNFEHITSAIPIVKITQRYENKSLCGQLAEKSLEILRDNNSTIAIGSKDFEHITSAIPIVKVT